MARRKKANWTPDEEKLGIGKVAVMCLKSGMSYKDALAAVKRVYPTANTTLKCMYYYAHHAGLSRKAKAQADTAELQRLGIQLNVLDELSKRKVG